MTSRDEELRAWLGETAVEIEALEKSRQLLEQKLLVLRERTERLADLLKFENHASELLELPLGLDGASRSESIEAAHKRKNVTRRWTDFVRGTVSDQPNLTVAQLLERAPKELLNDFATIDRDDLEFRARRMLRRHGDFVVDRNSGKVKLKKPPVSVPYTMPNRSESALVITGITKGQDGYTINGYALGNPDTRMALTFDQVLARVAERNDVWVSAPTGLEGVMRRAKDDGRFSLLSYAPTNTTHTLKNMADAAEETKA